MSISSVSGNDLTGLTEEEQVAYVGLENSILLDVLDKVDENNELLEEE